MKKLLLFSLLFCAEVSAQVGKVLISGLGGPADDSVVVSFRAGYASYSGATFTKTITKIVDGSNDASASFSFARTNGDSVIVRSTTGLAAVITTAASYPDVLAFMPAGSNSYVSVFNGDIATCPVVVTGAGDTQNRTGYSLEFWGPNPLTGGNLSGYGNAYVAGQMCFLADSLGKTIQEIRALSRANGTSLDVHNGYGVVNSAAIIHNVIFPVELTSFTAEVKGKDVELAWQTATEVNNYGFEVEKNISDSWDKIGFVFGNGTSNIGHSYSYVDASAVGKVLYRLKQIDRDGKLEYSKVVEINVSSPPTNFGLSQNFPNPFNPSTVISYQIPADEMVTLKVYDVLGREVASLVNEQKSAGVHQINFDGSGLSSGMYVYKIQAGSFVQTKKMLLTK